MSNEEPKTYTEAMQDISEESNEKVIEVNEMKPEYRRFKDKCYIVGFAPNWNLTPWQDADAEIWCLNEFYKYMQKTPGTRADRWFEIHSKDSPSKNNAEHQNFLKNCPVPVYMWEHYDDIPPSIRFPKDEIMQWMQDKGYIGYKYFTNSISWMIAMAMYMGYKEIHIYGVDMATNSEYQAQRPSCEYFIGIAEGLGIKFYLPPESDLMKNAGLYGFETDNQVRLKMKNRKKELDNRLKQMEDGIDKKNKELAILKQNAVACVASMNEIDYWLRNWSY